MNSSHTGDGKSIVKQSWLYYLIIFLVIEKTIQHVVVTLAFYFNWTGIHTKVVVPPEILMVTGAVVAVLFGLALWAMITKQRWAINLVIALALFDIISEFVAQGRIDIVIVVSFIVAVILLGLALQYRKTTT